MIACRMRLRSACLATFAAFACGSTPVSEPRQPPPATPPPGASGAWALVWSDEFEGPAGALVDATKWANDLGGNGWGNEELESYTDRGRNASLTGDGFLAIQAVREHYVGPDGIAREYTSARLKTQGRFEQAYGKFETRMKIPRGQGIWPAFWLLGANIATVDWPACGEIDVMENVGRQPATVTGTMHGPGYSGAQGIGAPFSLADGRAFADDFHVFTLEWEPSALRWYVDGALYETRTPADLPAGRTWVFDHPFFVIVNLAIGGGYPGNPDATTAFPQTLLVDYVRVYKRAA